ncbi:NAD(P)-binding protein [Mycena filopes]|nr:NAD(P)-binding protein [Mycena filopes]
MTITQDTSAPLVVVVGATGAQGGSVVKALAGSDRAYRVRSFTRDATKPVSAALKKQGVEMIQLNLVVENKEEVYKGFVGADFAFLVTNYWEHMDADKEIAEGKMLIDAVKASGGVKGLVWSGLVPVTKMSGGKYTRVAHFDGKAVITDYGRASGVPFVDVQAGIFATNFVGPASNLNKQSDGSYAIEWGIRPETVLPIINIEHDYGRFVRRAIEAPVFPDGSEVLTSSEDITMVDLTRQISEVTGKKVWFKQIPLKDWEDLFVAAGFPRPMASGVIEGYNFFDEFGYYGGKPSASGDGLGPGGPTKTWAEFVKEADWSKVLV